jgi:hypothetical protein
MIHPEVQALISSTNGRHYLDKINKLKSYPVYDLPVKPAESDSLMLEIGSGWGRWLVAGANKNYIPIGLDIHHHFCETCRHVLRDHNKSGYFVAGDLEHLPFTHGIFDLVWSFSVIQHTHIRKLRGCLLGISKMLHHQGFAKLEFPNKNGIHNRVHLKEAEKTRDDYESLNVRYYTLEEYDTIFREYFPFVKIENHSFLGIGIVPEDLKYVSFKNKLVCLASLAGSMVTNIIPALKNFSDSVYVIARNNQNKNVTAINHFLALHHRNPADNLNLVPLLKCPISGLPLQLSDDRQQLIAGNISYPVKNDIPILLRGSAQQLKTERTDSSIS